MPPLMPIFSSLFVQVKAVSHNLMSEPHTRFQAVLPNPPKDLLIRSVKDNNITLAWTAPENSLFTEYIIRHRPYATVQPWTEVTVSRNLTSYTLSDLPPGEHSWQLAR